MSETNISVLTEVTNGPISDFGKDVVDQSNYLDIPEFVNDIKTEVLEDIKDTSIVEIKYEELSLEEIRIQKADTGELDNLNTKDLDIKKENSNLITKCDNADYEEYNEQPDIHDIKQKNDYLAKPKKPPGTYYCNDCSYFTYRKSDLKKHIMRHRKTNFATIHKCTTCEYLTVHKDDLYSHTRRTHMKNVPMYKCLDCSYKTKRSGNLTRHFLTHKKPDKELMYKCNQCSYQAKHKQNLSRHAIIHNRSKDWKAHQRFWPKKEIIIYNCLDCSYQSKRKHDFIRHTLVHKKPEEIELFKCKWCSFQTKFKSNLKGHSIRHLE